MPDSRALTAADTDMVMEYLSNPRTLAQALATAIESAEKRTPSHGYVSLDINAARVALLTLFRRAR